eukprot:2551612-Rhodomonas_salina.1
MKACEKGDTATAALLIDTDADVHAKSKNVRVCGGRDEDAGEYGMADVRAVGRGTDSVQRGQRELCMQQEGGG